MAKVLQMPVQPMVPATTASVLTAEQVVPRHRFADGSRVRVIVHPGTSREQMDDGTVLKRFEDGCYNITGDHGGIFIHVPANQVTPLPQN